MPVPYAATVERFLQRLSNEGRSPRTLAAYRYDLDDSMVEVASIQGLLPSRPALDRLASDEREARVLGAFEELDVASITADQLDEAVADFRTRPDPRFLRHPERAPEERSPATVARRMAAIRSFFAWCYRTGRVGADPAALLQAPKKRKRLPRGIDQPTAMKALDVASRSSWPERDLLIVALALACGLRLDEVARLQMNDVEGDPPRAVVVRGKGDKERRLGLPPVAQEALRTYL
ncbi:MAG TPA: tyrosine-type recombinase/integrase, partial [Acidimicrobiales bacterium]|nr:tyrosine-type recombinase/integrase [Acidimicrobiales bacterium]